MVSDMTRMAQDAFDLALVDLSCGLRAYFRRRICDPAVAEDLAQETLLKAFCSRHKLRDLRRIQSWLYAIARCTALDFYRAKRTHSELRIDVIEEHRGVANDIREVLACSARCYLRTLPGAYRVPVQLADCDGLSHREVAHTLGLSLSATKTRIRRGKLMVRSLMEAQCEFQYDVVGNVVGYEVRAVPRVIATFK